MIPRLQEKYKNEVVQAMLKSSDTKISWKFKKKKK